MRARDVADLVLLAALWGASFLFTRLAVPGFGPVATAALRVGVATVVLLGWMATRGGGAALRRHAGALLVVGLVNSALPFLLFAYALQTLTAGLAAVLNATSPMFTALVARAWLGERLTPARSAGLALGLAGVVALVYERIGVREADTARIALAALACLLASALYGFSANFTRRRLSGADPFVVAAGSQAAAAIALGPFAVAAWPDAAPGLVAWLALAALGVASTALAYALYFRLIANVGPARAITVTFLIPLFGTGFGAVFLGEAVTPAMVAGGAVVLLGTALAAGISPRALVPGRRSPTAPARRA